MTQAVTKKRKLTGVEVEPDKENAQEVKTPHPVNDMRLAKATSKVEELTAEINKCVAQMSNLRAHMIELQMELEHEELQEVKDRFNKEKDSTIFEIEKLCVEAKWIFTKTPNCSRINVSNSPLFKQTTSMTLEYVSNLSIQFLKRGYVLVAAEVIFMKNVDKSTFFLEKKRI